MSDVSLGELRAIAARLTADAADARPGFVAFTATSKPKVGQTAWVWGFGYWRRGVVTFVARTRAVVSYTTESSSRVWGRPERFDKLRRHA